MGGRQAGSSQSLAAGRPPGPETSALQGGWRAVGGQRWGAATWEPCGTPRHDPALRPGRPLHPPRTTPNAPPPRRRPPRHRPQGAWAHAYPPHPARSTALLSPQTPPAHGACRSPPPHAFPDRCARPPPQKASPPRPHPPHPHVGAPTHLGDAAGGLRASGAQHPLGHLRRRRRRSTTRRRFGRAEARADGSPPPPGARRERLVRACEAHPQAGVGGGGRLCGRGIPRQTRPGAAPRGAFSAAGARPRHQPGRRPRGGGAAGGGGWVCLGRGGPPRPRPSPRTLPGLPRRPGRACKVGSATPAAAPPRAPTPAGARH